MLDAPNIQRRAADLDTPVQPQRPLLDDLPDGDIEPDESLPEEAAALARRIAGHGHHALRRTKALLNEVDGSLDDTRVRRHLHGVPRVRRDDAPRDRQVRGL